MSLPVLNIVGTGRLGPVVGRLLMESGAVGVGGLFSRQATKAQQAARFIGAGTPHHELDDLPAADLWLLSVADDAIGPVAVQLAARPLLWEASLVFHCSGIHSSDLLAPLRERGARVASLHPAHSFADPSRSRDEFAGSCCTLEGDVEAEETLKTLFAPLGTHIIAIEPHYKPLYHAATAVASNHLVALLDSSLEMLSAAGVGAGDARRLLEPLVTRTIGNLFDKGAAAALTGPVARGDSGTIKRHLEAVSEGRSALVPSYMALAELALGLVPRNNTRSGHEEIARLLKEHHWR